MSTGAHFDDLHAPADGNTATMSNRLPYNFDNQYTAHPSSHSHSAAHSTVTDPFSSILSPSQPPHHAMTVAEWAGIAVDTGKSEVFQFGTSSIQAYPNPFILIPLCYYRPVV